MAIPAYSDVVRNSVSAFETGGGGSSVNETLRALLASASVAMRNNPRTRGPVLDPPTVTVGTSTPTGGFTRIYTFEGSNSPFVAGGGLPTTTSGITSFPVCTPSGSTQVGRHWRVETILDGDEVSFLLDSATVDGYRFLVDGQYVSLIGTVSGSGDPRYYTLTFPARGRYRIAVEGHTALRFDEARVPDDCTLLPPERANPLRVIVVGDSNIEAYPLALKGDGIGAILGDQLGVLDVWASGVFGTGLIADNSGASYTYAQRRTDWTTRSPDVLILSLSINDVIAGASQATIKTAVATELAQARSALPGVPIFVVGMVASEEYLSANSLLTLAGQQETGAQEAVDEADDPLIAMIPTINAAIDSPFVGTPGNGNWDLYVDGTTHANALGQLYGGQWLAHRLIDAAASMAGIPAPTLALPQTPVEAGGATEITGPALAGRVAGTLGAVEAIPLGNGLEFRGGSLRANHIAPRVNNATNDLLVTDIGACVVKNNTTAYSWTIPPDSTFTGTFPDLASIQGKCILLINDGTAGNLTILRGTSVALLNGTSDASLVLGPGQSATIYHMPTANRWRVL